MEFNIWQKYAAKECLEIIQFLIAGVINDPGDLANRLRQIAYQVERYKKTK